MRESDRVWAASMPAIYQRSLVPAVFLPFAVDLAQRVMALAPGRILELAAGTGVLTGELLAAADADRSVEVTATDLNEGMVELGRANAPAAAWRQADAMQLPFDDAQFDVVACQFGAMFFPDRAAAFAESRRVLVPGGRLLLNTWGPLDGHDFEVVLVAALRDMFPDDPPTFIASVPHGCADPGPVVAELSAGGFVDIAVETVTVEGHAPSAADLAAGYCGGTPVRAELEARGADLEAATAQVAAAMEARLGSGPIVGRMVANVFSAG